MRTAEMAGYRCVTFNTALVDTFVSGTDPELGSWNTE